jgi:hypothetical protein
MDSSGGFGALFTGGGSAPTCFGSGVVQWGFGFAAILDSGCGGVLVLACSKGRGA